MRNSTKKAVGGKPEIVLLAAMARNRVIGRQGTIPWRLPRDLARFRQRTMGSVVIMGRRTWQSIGRPLPDRRVVVLSRDPGFAPRLPGVTVARGLQQAIARHGQESALFIAGGEGVYRESLPLADRVELSVLDRAVEGDTWFPPLPAGRFVLERSERIEDVEPFTLRVYVRRPEQGPDARLEPEEGE